MEWFDKIWGAIGGTTQRAPQAHDPEPPPPTPAPPVPAHALSAVGVPEPRIALYLPHLNAACQEFGITSRARVAAFLAQIIHESGHFRFVSEIWGPTDAQRRYEGRRDLGNVFKGDGYLFRGHGLIQVTGRTNHDQVARRFGLPSALAAVSWLQTPEGACRSAAWYWQSHGCNELADSGDFRSITRRINGGFNGYEIRLALYATLRSILA